MNRRKQRGQSAPLGARVTPPLPSTPPSDLRVVRFRHGDDEIAVLSYSHDSPTLPSCLSPAEREVVELALVGMTNEQIALQRGCSQRTIANQLASVFRKLGVRSRVELAVRCLFAS